MLSIVIPVRNEAENIRTTLKALSEAVRVPAEVLIVYDHENDPTLPVVRSLTPPPTMEYRLIRNTLGNGPANALKAGFAAAKGEALVVTMADLSDDLPALATMLDRFSEGYDLVSGSRYMRGGEQVGGPWLKGKLSNFAGVSLHLLGLPTHDPTNSYKLYRTERLRQLSLQSRNGFEINLEIVVKAWRAGWRITEVPARWVDRVAGRSKFKLWRWLPRYLRWYSQAVVVALTPSRVHD
jgi:glycosyltransferase involved in cell wall biosynthesis